MPVLELEVWGSPAAEGGLGKHQHVLGSVLVLVHRKRLKLAHAQTLLLRETLRFGGVPNVLLQSQEKIKGYWHS